jgi:hypothetical protein
MSYAKLFPLFLRVVASLPCLLGPSAPRTSPPVPLLEQRRKRSLDGRDPNSLVREAGLVELDVVVQVAG